MNSEINSLSSYHDIARLGQLRMDAANNPDASVQEVARQFESIFLNLMLQGAREAMSQEGIFSSPQLKTYQQMFDQQVAMDLADSGGIGLAKIIARQLQHTEQQAPLIREEQNRG